MSQSPKAIWIEPSHNGGARGDAGGIIISSKTIPQQTINGRNTCSALFFGLAHWEQGSVGLYRATAFGFAAAILYLKLGDLRPLILAHALIDLYIFW